MRLVSVALLASMLVLAGCRKDSNPPAAQPPQPQEVQWYQGTSATTAPSSAREPAAPVLPTAQLAVSGSNVVAQLSNVRPGTALTLAWFGPDGWNVTNQTQVVSGTSVTFAVPKFGTPGRYQAELLNGVQLLGTIDL